LNFAYALCASFAFIGSELKWKRKRIALDNIKIVFPERTKKERKFVFRESLKNMLKNYFEIAYIAGGRFTSKEILQMASASGLERLDNLKSTECGALLYSGHFGNFPLMNIWLAIKGYPVAAIYKEAKNFPDDFFGNIMRRFGVIPLKYKSDAGMTTSIVRALKDGKIVFIQNDQSHPSGIYINFFNKYVPSPAGPALLAKRVGVPIIPAYIYRESNNHHKITVFDEIPLRHEEDFDKSLKLNTQIQIDWIAEILKKHPAEWLWLHNRWKRAKNNES
jgi:KDO2-lipid IV(A) lauroyltransferase